MKKLLFCFLLLSGVLTAQNQSIDSTKYDYIGYAIDSTIYAGNSSYINKIFDKDYIINKVAIKSDDKYINEFNQGFTKGIKESFDYGQKVINDVGDEGSFDFIRSRVNSKGEYHLLFRLFVDGGLNYHDYKIQEVDGEIKIVDVFYFITGEYLTETFSNLYTAALSNRPNVITKFFKKSIIDDFLKLKSIKELMANEKYEEAHKVYKTTSSEGKKQKAFQLIKIQITYYLEESIYKDAIENYEKSFPNDPSLYLVSIDGYILAENYSKALEQINKLDKAVNGDSFLNYYRANIFYLKKEFKTSNQYLEILMEDYPYLFDGFDIALTIFIEGSNYNKAMEVLNIMVDRFEVPKETLLPVIKENFPLFSKDKLFLEWSKK